MKIASKAAQAPEPHPVPSEPVSAEQSVPPSEASAPGPTPDEPAEPEPACAPELVIAAAEADRRLRTEGTCAKEALASLGAAVQALSTCAGELKPTAWIFPVEGVGLESIGGQGNGYVRSAFLPCYATPSPGHPAHDIFVDDPHHGSRDRQGRPFIARAVEEGRVLVAHDGWTPDDPGRGGNYLMLLLPARRLIAYYAHLETILVRPGERVRAGQAIGTIGRTGRNAWLARSPTHLHFGLWNASSFVPVNSLALLKAAQRTAQAAKP